LHRRVRNVVFDELETIGALEMADTVEVEIESDDAPAAFCLIRRQMTPDESTSAGYQHHTL
jgi:hypothetical protein